jgi:hypothetical protein
MKILAAKNPSTEAGQMEMRYALKQKHHLKRAAVRVSIMVLALGFSMIGLLSLIGKHHVCDGTGISLENVSSIIGGTTSFMLGGIFLVAGALHWDHSYSG